MSATAISQRQRWTTAEEKNLLAAANGRGGKNLATLFEQVAADRGVSPSTVRSKYYALKKPRKGARGSWSKRAANQLVREVAAVTGRDRTKVFDEWAKRRGVSVGAIKQKHYQLAGGAKPATSELPALAPSRNGAADPNDMQARSAASAPASDIAGMTMLELAQLGRRVSDELERRIASVASLWT